MDSARYGRMKLGRCLSRNYMIGCSGDVLKQADLRCSGKHNCTIRVPDETFHEVQPCPKDVMAYMEASYSCLPITTPPHKTCSPIAPLLITEKSGHIASASTADLAIGTNLCPWIIRVGTGQRINVTLMDFNTLTYNPTSSICQVYATIRGKKDIRDITVCAGGKRIHHVMLSDGNEIEISIMQHNTAEKQPSFVIRFEGIIS